MNPKHYGDVVESLREQSEKQNGILVLSRRVDESVVIDEDITIKVLSVSNGQVKLGIEAPRDVRIRRAELPLTDELRVHNPDGFPWGNDG